MTFFDPISLLFGYERSIAFGTVTGFANSFLLTAYRVVRYVSFLKLSFSLLIEPLLTGSECFSGLRVVNNGFVVRGDGAYGQLRSGVLYASSNQRASCTS